MQNKKAIIQQRKAHEIKPYSDKVERLKKRGVEMITKKQCKIKKTFATPAFSIRNKNEDVLKTKVSYLKKVRNLRYGLQQRLELFV